MNPQLRRLQPYPFIRWNALVAGVRPAELSPIRWSIGEPQHAPPTAVLEALCQQVGLVASYPATRGLPELRAAIAGWLERRYGLPRVDPATQVLPCLGTREALFAFAQAVLQPGDVALMPNPFYQIYEGAALLAGAEPAYLACLPEADFLPDFLTVPPEQWEATALVTICSPGNPTGAVLPLDRLMELIALADRFDFVIASDECYSELYDRDPPPGLLQACAAMGRDSFERCVVFHSLSKRSNLPGLRSGFVAGDAALIEPFYEYRTYHGSAMPLHHQRASLVAWSDEAHVEDNRQRYREKFAAVLPILEPVLDVRAPAASFYLWARVPEGFGGDVAFAKALYESENLTVLPGSYLSREVGGVDPGADHIRMALVASYEECVEGARRLRRFIETKRGMG